MPGPVDDWLRRAYAHGRRIASKASEPSLETTESDDAGIPVPPARLRRLVSGWDEKERWLASGVLDARLIRELVEHHNGALRDMSAILDLGCGCGRVTRCWANLAGPKIYGSDYDSHLTDWCRTNLPFVTVATNAADPPLPFADESFDLVYAISLFTHLAEESQDRWIGEIWRVLKPGGMVLFTTHGEIFLNHVSDEEQAIFSRGEPVVHNARESGMGSCATFHPQSFVEGRLLPGAGLQPIAAVAGNWTTNLDWTPMVLQDKYLARKRQS